MPYGYDLPEDFQKQLRRNRLFEILASAGGALGTGRVGSAMLAGVAGANRNRDRSISEFLDEQFRREQEERYRQREERMLAQQEEQERLRREARASEDQALEALASRVGSLAYGDESSEAQGVAMLGARDVGGLSRLLGSLEERRKLQELGINPDDPASRQRYLIEQGVDAPPGGQGIRQAATGEFVQIGPDGTWQKMGGYNPQTPRQWQMQPSESEDPLLKQARSAVARELATGAITPEVAAARIAETYEALKRGQDIATGRALPPVPPDIATLGAPSISAEEAERRNPGPPIPPSERHRWQRPQQRVVGSGGPAGGGQHEPVLAAALARFPQAAQQFDIEAAKRAGYTDEDIAREIERLFGGGM